MLSRCKDKHFLGIFCFVLRKILYLIIKLLFIDKKSVFYLEDVHKFVNFAAIINHRDGKSKNDKVI